MSTKGEGAKKKKERREYDIGMTEESIVREQISRTTAAGNRANSQSEGLPKVAEGSLPPAKEVRICAHE